MVTDLTSEDSDPAHPVNVSVTFSASSVARGVSSALTFRRLSGFTHATLAIIYATSGTARERYGFGGLPKMAVIPPGVISVTVPLRTLPRWRSTDPATVTLTASITAGHGYLPPDPSTGSSTLTITDG